MLNCEWINFWKSRESLALTFLYASIKSLMFHPIAWNLWVYLWLKVVNKKEKECGRTDLLGENGRTRNLNNLGPLTPKENPLKFHNFVKIPDFPQLSFYSMHHQCQRSTCKNACSSHNFCSQRIKKHFWIFFFSKYFPHEFLFPNLYPV